MAAYQSIAALRMGATLSPVTNVKSLRKQTLSARAPAPRTAFRTCRSTEVKVLRKGLAGHSVSGMGRGGAVRVRAASGIENEDQFTGARDKALQINLDPSIYGSFAEIGAGQEVARWFFSVGGAAGTVAKSVSAYDMTISDSYYGQCQRYVTMERLESMLEYEYVQCALPLRNARGNDTCFFAYANTVVARAYRRMNECHGWMGVKWQTSPGAQPSRIMIHIRMLDATAPEQQEALGVFGVNFIHTVFYKYKQLATLSPDTKGALQSLIDELSSERIEVDLIRVEGPDFRDTDNRVLALQLVDAGLTDAVLFNSKGTVMIPSDYLRKQNVLLHRGNFRPPTVLTSDILSSSAEQMFCDSSASFDDADGLVCVAPENSKVVTEMTLSDIRESGDGLDWTESKTDFMNRTANDFLDRVETLNKMGYPCIVSNFFEYFKVAAYLRRATRENIVICLGVPAVKELFKEEYYKQLEGGILENFGRLVTAGLKIYVYPVWNVEKQKLCTAENIKLPESVKPLYDFLYNQGTIAKVESYDLDLLKKYAANTVNGSTIQMIRSGAPGWEDMVTPEVADLIQEGKLFGLNSSFEDF